MTNNQQNWHTKSAEETLESFGADAEYGLNTSQVEVQLATFGTNTLTERKGKGPIVRLLLQIHQPLLYILIAAAAITAFFQEWVDSGVIFGIVIINAIIGFVQESKALTAIAALKRSLISEATVLRNGETRRISSTELVPGDIVMLASGDKVPADMRLIKMRNLQIDESVLTGESVPVHKAVDTCAEETQLADRHNLSYASTLVTYGTATGVVVATGDHTEVGKISEMIATAEALETPLTKKINRFSSWLLIAIMVFAVLTFVIGIIRGHQWFDMFMAAVALAVGAIPEGLPAAVTIILALGVSRMAKHHTIIRRLPAVETLGSTTIICTDKTGTLTKNEMTVTEVYANNRHYDVSGVGYAPDGAFAHDGKPVHLEHEEKLLKCLNAALLCNDADIAQAEQEWVPHGDPTEAALVTAAAKAGLSKQKAQSTYPRIDAIPFESQNQYMATLHRSLGGNITYIKGSLEKLLPRCAGADAERITHIAEEMAARGLRVLAVAQKQHTGAELHTSDIEDGLEFLGLVAMIDPPRPEAIEAVAACLKAGIHVKMITGDHAITAQAIAKQLGIGVDEHETPHVMTSRDLEKLSDEEFLQAALDTDVFARTTPEHKLRLVEALQSKGNIVAMTGDGVNDAPALQRADIGVAMGKGGTEVAREASDMVITNDNFASIEQAVEEGRGVFDNLLKFIVWTVPVNLGEGLVVIAAIFLGVALPITPVQILWINMTTAGCLGLMLAFEPMEKGIMLRKPRDPRKPILTHSIIVRIVIVSVLLCIGSFALYEWALRDGAAQAQARTIAVNVFVIGELFFLFSCRSLTKSIFRVGLFTNMWIWLGVAIAIGLQMAFTYAPFMNRLFHTAPFPAEEWIKIVIIGSLISLVVGIDKWIVNLVSQKTN